MVMLARYLMQMRVKGVGTCARSIFFGPGEGEEDDDGERGEGEEVHGRGLVNGYARCGILVFNGLGQFLFLVLEEEDWRFVPIDNIWL